MNLFKKKNFFTQSTYKSFKKSWFQYFRKKKKEKIKIPSKPKQKEKGKNCKKIVKINWVPIEIKISDLLSSQTNIESMFVRLIQVLSKFKCEENSFEEINWIQYSDKYDAETRRNQSDVISEKFETVDESFENFAQVSSPVGEYVYRFFYEDLHFEVIDMATVVIASLTISSSIDTFEDCLIRYRKSTNEFIRRLEQLVYIESTITLTSDEIIFGKLLPILWNEFNDHSFTYSFNVSSNVALEVKKQISLLSYKKLHILLMKIANLYTLISLDYLTIVQKEWDIHKSVILFRDKLDILLRMGYTYFRAMVEKDEVFYSLVDTPYDAFKLHHSFLLDRSPICTYFDAVIGIAHALKIIFDTLARVNAFKFNPDLEYTLAVGKKSKKKLVVKTLIFKDVKKRLELFFKTGQKLDKQIIENYVSVPTLTYLNHIFIQSGLRLTDFFLFNRFTDSENLNFHPTIIKLERDLYEDDTNHLKKFSRIQFPLQIFNLSHSDWDRLLILEKIKSRMNLSLNQKYKPFWKCDLIKLILKNGFVPKQTQIEVEIARKEEKWYFWEGYDEVKKRVLEQFAIETVLKDNIVRTREWRSNFLFESLQRKRFLEIRLDMYFKEHESSPIQAHYLNTINNLASRLFWRSLVGISDEILRIIFPVEWFDPLLIALSFHILNLQELKSQKYFKTSLMYQVEYDNFFNFRPKDINLGIILQKVKVKMEKNNALTIG